MEQRLKVHSLKLLTDKDGWKLVILFNIAISLIAIFIICDGTLGEQKKNIRKS